MKIFLVGYMGSGKSTTGKKIAGRLNYEFVDLDHFIEKQSGLTIPAIFEKFCEDKFRNLEHEALQNLISKSNHVISTGGGTPCFFDNMALMNQNGITIYLKLTIRQLFERLHKRIETRPLLKGKSDADLTAYIEQSLNERDPFYNQAHYVIDGFTPDIDMIVRILMNN